MQILEKPSQLWKLLRIQSTLPDNHPAEFLRQPRPRGKVIVCLGDSLTHGNVSFNWVGRLRVDFAHQNLHFVNAGINGNVVWQLNQRLPLILKARPHVAIVLIGTNDVMGSFDRADGIAYQRGAKLPNLPSQDNFRLEYRKLLRALRDVPRVAACTLPPLGERPDSPVNRLVESFNADIRVIAHEEGATLLPLGEKLFEVIASTEEPPQDYHPGPIRRLIPILQALGDHYLRKQTWDQSAANRGLTLLPDHIHLGERGGSILADLVTEFIQRN